MSVSITVSGWGEKMAVSGWEDENRPMIDSTKFLDHIRADSQSTVPKPSRSRSGSYLTVSTIQNIGLPRTFTPRLNVPPARPLQGLVHVPQKLDPSRLEPGLKRTSSNCSWRADNTLPVELEDDIPSGAKQRPVSWAPTASERRHSLPKPLSIHALSTPLWSLETVRPLPEQDDMPTPQVTKKPRPKSYLALVTLERPKYADGTRTPTESTLSVPHKRSSSLFSLDRLLAVVSPKQPRCTSYSSIQSTLVGSPRHPVSLRTPGTPISSCESLVSDRKAFGSSNKTSSGRQPYVYPSYQPQPDLLYLLQLEKGGHRLPSMPNRIPCPREQKQARGYQLNKPSYRPVSKHSDATPNKKEKEKDVRPDAEEEHPKLLSPFIPYYKWSRSRAQHLLALSTVSPSSPPSPSNDIKLAYNLRTGKFRLEKRNIPTRNTSSTSLKDLSLLEHEEGQDRQGDNKSSALVSWFNDDMPPMLCDGRMVIVPLPKTSDRVLVHWRTFDGVSAHLKIKEVVFPNWVVMGISLGKFEEMFVECG
ncbi:uncharacterized protein PAC_11271 [Phialocephala subalpina]|uniref:Uncharacterized protein n=1 Tax=Phialocephala subalpina TaxID=576137 RepID=A0A1L7X8L0_9HELO|nr:uncharacterized protein PAC_11271 [Phialocephala subalpina]